MVIIITGATHTGKTRLAQLLLEKYHYPYVSEDHIKMGLIRSGYTDLTPADDAKMTGYLWPVIREMIKTAIENRQNLIVEGCYVPFDWKVDFSEAYLQCIKFICLCMSEHYIETHFGEIKQYASCVESRIDDDYCTPEILKRENQIYYTGCVQHNLHVVMINGNYTETVRNAVCILEHTDREVI